ADGAEHDQAVDPGLDHRVDVLERRRHVQRLVVAEVGDGGGKDPLPVAAHGRQAPGVVAPGDNIGAGRRERQRGELSVPGTNPCSGRVTCANAATASDADSMRPANSRASWCRSSSTAPSALSGGGRSASRRMSGLLALRYSVPASSSRSLKRLSMYSCTSP